MDVIYVLKDYINWSPLGFANQAVLKDILPTMNLTIVKVVMIVAKNVMVYQHTIAPNVKIQVLLHIYYQVDAFLTVQ